jgi:hypothetical protein
MLQEGFHNYVMSLMIPTNSDCILSKMILKVNPWDGKNNLTHQISTNHATPTVEGKRSGQSGD